MFKEERNYWKVEEIATNLQHPKEPIKNLLKMIGDLDVKSKYYSLKRAYQ